MTNLSILPTLNSVLIFAILLFVVFLLSNKFLKTKLGINYLAYSIFGIFYVTILIIDFLKISYPFEIIYIPAFISIFTFFTGNKFEYIPFKL